MVVGIKSPYLMISTRKNGKKKLFVNSDSGDEISLQWRDIVFEAYSSIDFLDSNGVLFEDVKTSKKSIDFGSYRQFGFSGWIAFLIDVVLLSVLVRCETILGDFHNVDIEDVKDYLADMIESSKNGSTVPDDDLKLILKKSKNISMLIALIMRNQ